jgi:peptidoglycan/LPS O-acetylase OafA/YrhL
MKIIRSLLSLIAGYLIFALAMVLLWMAFGYKPKDIPPEGFLVFSICCECLIAVGAGYAAAKIVNWKEMAHTGILTGVFAFLGVLALIWPHNALPWWANLATIFPIAPCFLLGGLMWITKKNERKGNLQ